MAGRARKLRWASGGLAVLAVVLVGGPFVYIHFIEGAAAAKLSLPTSRSPTTTSSAAPGSGSSSSSDAVDGTWNVGAGSVVGYRVQEVLIGQQSTAVGRTSSVSGSIAISGASVTGGSFTVDMGSVKSDQSERNAQFDGRIMDVRTYPTAKLVLTAPIALGTLPADGTVTQFPATGALTMHGVTNAVTFTVSAERRGGTLFVLADLPVVFSRWDIANPSVGGFVTTQDSGTLEVLLHLVRGTGNAAVTGSSAPGSATPGGGPVTVPQTTVPRLTVPTG